MHSIEVVFTVVDFEWTNNLSCATLRKIVLELLRLKLLIVPFGTHWFSSPKLFAQNLQELHCKIVSNFDE